MVVDKLRNALCWRPITTDDRPPRVTCFVYFGECVESPGCRVGCEESLSCFRINLSNPSTLLECVLNCTLAAQKGLGVYLSVEIGVVELPSALVNVVCGVHDHDCPTLVCGFDGEVFIVFQLA